MPEVRSSGSRRGLGGNEFEGWAASGKGERLIADWCSSRFLKNPQMTTCMSTARTTSVPRTMATPVKLTSLSSVLTSGCSARPSGCGVSSTMTDRLPALGLLPVVVAQLLRRLAAQVLPRQQGGAPQLPGEVRQPQPAHRERRHEVDPVLEQGRARQAGQDLVVVED